LAEELGMSKDEIRKTYWAGLLHDIGKVLVSSSILNKPGKLTTEEFDEIRKHPKYGYDILKTSDALKDIAEIVYAHHERIDGSGYPRGLKGDEIPFEAKIIAVVDSFNAMTSDRPYRPALSVNTAMKELIRGAGRLYEARIVRTFIHMIAKMENEAMG
ncbi:MAG: HD-GYP domain-containing protein, partial [Thermotoga sp.]